MVDWSLEELLSFSEVARLLPKRRGKAVNVSTIHRWAQRGSRGVRLEYLQTPAGKMTSRAAIYQFIERLTAVAAGAPPAARSTTQRERAIARAEKELDDAGI